ncbi:MAG TPA: hypothetical protein VIY08_00875 [Candidatus Nitrosocosmicus sp.]
MIVLGVSACHATTIGFSEKLPYADVDTYSMLKDVGVSLTVYTRKNRN